MPNTTGVYKKQEIPLSAYCDKGHAFTEDNTIYRKRNRGRGEEISRECRICHYNRNRKYEKTFDIAHYKWLGHIRRTYNLSEKDYSDMLLFQNGKCAICGKEKDKLCIDHDHKTGEVRGLLCIKCNSNLGWYENNKEKINNYLNKNDGRDKIN